MASEELIDEINMHQKTISTDSNSPLQLIRERELEISGRMLTAKREADELVAAARKKAAELVAAAEAEGGSGAREREKAIVAEAEKTAAELKLQAQTEAEQITAAIKSRMDAAAQLVVDAVTES